MRRRELNVRNRWYLLADACLFACGSLVGYVSRFDGSAGAREFADDLPHLAITIPLRVGILWAFGAYQVVWRHATAGDVLRIGVAGVVAGFANLLVGGYLLEPLGIIDNRVPLSVLTFSWLVAIVGPAGLRMAERLVFLRATPVVRAGSSIDRRRRRVLIAGAGEAGRQLVEELRRRGETAGMDVVGFLDRDRQKHGLLIAGLPVLGSHEQLEAIARASAASELLVAMPSASGADVRAIVERARALKLPVRTVPGLGELAAGRVTVETLRPVQITDLLRREPITTDQAAVRALIEGRRVLVTGAGGSIGSELCRQIAQCHPASLGLLGHGENSIFEIQGELRQRWPEVRLETFIADIRDRPRLATVFDHFEPDLVFHAAAHKHVPLMEENPAEAVTNNIAGTWNIAELSAAHEVQGLVVISTDKAVNPTNVMGASKRVGEQLVQELAANHGRRFMAVRFGNVLGSRGSVVPTFLRQIRAGGPLTLTDPEMTRYFMTIPEAVQLVLQAAVLGDGGEIFALDMGAPVKIVDLATDLIRLSGLEPGRDIEIIFTGVRPGEKLYEEVFFEGDGVRPTAHPKIRKVLGSEVPVGLISVVRFIELRANSGATHAELRWHLKRLVREYETTAPVEPPPRGLAQLHLTTHE